MRLTLLLIATLLLGGCSQADYYQGNKEVNIAIVTAWKAHLDTLQRAEERKQIADRTHQRLVMYQLREAMKTESLVDDMTIQTSYSMYLLGRGNQSRVETPKMPTMVISERPNDIVDGMVALTPWLNAIVPWIGAYNMSNSSANGTSIKVGRDYNYLSPTTTTETMAP